MPARLQPVPLQQDRDQSSFGFLHEGHSTATIAVDPDEVTQLYLPGWHQILWKENNMLLDARFR
jgi:hypothetical protein